MFEIIGKYNKILVTNDNTEQEAIQQLYDIDNCKAYEGCKIVVQPDCHCGKGSTIGFCCKLPEDWKYINPSTVGVDIGCEISAHFYDKPIPEEKYADFNHKVLTQVGFGFNLSPKKTYDDKDLYKYLTKWCNKMKSMNPEIFEWLPERIDDQFLSKMLKRIGMDEKTFYWSVNSVGGGNHFCEYDENEELKKYGICVHCGSRNFGLKVCNYWANKAKGAVLSKEEIKRYTKEFKESYIKSHTDSKGHRDMVGFKDALNKYLDSKKVGHIEGFLIGDNAIGYCCDMVIALAYARFNHEQIHKTIDNIVAKYGLKCVHEIVSTHNYIDFTEGTPIIRKGAIRSYIGEEMIVPFNMRDGLAICEGKSNEEWLNSCAHGAGRAMSRSKAKSSISLDEFKDSMKGIYSTTVCEGTIDESPMAYKDTDEIKSLIQNTATIKYMMKPKINIKATETKNF